MLPWPVERGDCVRQSAQADLCGNRKLKEFADQKPTENTRRKRREEEEGEEEGGEAHVSCVLIPK